MMIHWYSKIEAEKLFAYITSEFQSYPWQEAGIPCWIKVIRLITIKNNISDEAFDWAVVVGTSHNDILPPHLPSPRILREIAVVRSDYPWNDPSPDAKMPNYFKVLDMWVP